MAAAAGRDASEFQLQVVAIPEITPSARAGTRPPFVGSLEQLREDVARTREAGATELIFQIELGDSPDRVLAAMDQLRSLVE